MGKGNDEDEDGYGYGVDLRGRGVYAEVILPLKSMSHLPLHQ